MKNVLIIGGTGTISTPVMETLAKDPEIRLSVLNRGKRKAELPEGVEHLSGDIREKPEDVKKLLAGRTFDCVISFIVMKETDAQIQYDLFSHNTKQFIFISTVCVLDGDPDCCIDEVSPYGNRYSPYGKEKEACERYFLKQYRENGFPLSIVRPSQTYSNERIPLSVKGKNCWSVVSRMIRGKQVIVHGDGQSVWASTHAVDFAKMFCPLVCREDSVGQIYQIMNPRPHTWDMVYEDLAEELGVEYKPVYISAEILDLAPGKNFVESIHGDKHYSKIFDISKIRTITPDVTCAIDLKTGIHMYLEYMNEHPELKVEDPQFDTWCDRTIEAYQRALESLKKELAGF